jgi:hypothetical protein
LRVDPETGREVYPPEIVPFVNEVTNKLHIYMAMAKYEADKAAQEAKASVGVQAPEAAPQSRQRQQMQHDGMRWVINMSDDLPFIREHRMSLRVGVGGPARNRYIGDHGGLASTYASPQRSSSAQSLSRTITPTQYQPQPQYQQQSQPQQQQLYQTQPLHHYHTPMRSGGSATAARAQARSAAMDRERVLASTIGIPSREAALLGRPAISAAVAATMPAASGSVAQPWVPAGIASRKAKMMSPERTVVIKEYGYLLDADYPFIPLLIVHFM